MNELTTGEIVDAKDTHGTTDSEVFIVVGDCNSVKLFRFALVRTTIQNSLGIYFSQVPISNSSFLTNCEELVVINWTNGEAVKTTHALLLCTDTLLSLQIPTKYRFVTST